MVVVVVVPCLACLAAVMQLLFLGMCIAMAVAVGMTVVMPSLARIAAVLIMHVISVSLAVVVAVAVLVVMLGFVCLATALSVVVVVAVIMPGVIMRSCSLGPLGGRHSTAVLPLNVELRHDAVRTTAKDRLDGNLALLARDDGRERI
mmetsp:Transcript_24192/g.71807  ORF Transcript_24192/g.71807 Transcript_24192/m.71807 type:complete len:147 (-) Transcript_24192:671-1111(-)